MRTYRNISIDFWTDPKIDDDFTPHEKYLYLYFLTGPHTNICGCYQVARNQIARETGLDWSEVEQCIARMQDIHEVIRYNPDTKEILVINWKKYNWSRSPKVRDAVLAVAKHIRDPEYQDFILQAVASHWETAPEAVKEERTKEENRNQKSEISNQKPETEYSISNRKYRYPMDRVSDTGAETEVGDKEKQKEIDFDSLWNAYPAKRRVNRAKCREAFDAVVVPASELLDALSRQIASADWTKEGGKYIPGLYKWLTESRWETAPEAVGFTPGQEELEAVRELKALRDATNV